ncbi:MAG: MBL fold metallo-hydrolase [Anaerolineae bacterium]|nr:MBL fold metallo-hydrolase [Anaerolineae bacterium]
MEITWYGLSCFRLVERGRASIVTDPYGIIWGYPQLKLRGSVVTVSQDSLYHNFVDAVSDVQRTLTGPGEYEIGGVFIIGAVMIDPRRRDAEHNVAYLFDFDGLAVLHLGALDFVPSQSAVEQMGAVDVAMVPVGGALDAPKAAEVVSLLEPSIVIPMYYKTPKLSLELQPVDKFLKEMGVTQLPEEASLKVTRPTLPEQTQVVLLENRQELDSM